jgi:putative PIN family toxin of toxin-antitoxin system
MGVVLDTNVLVSALRSSRGASHQVLRRIDSDAIEVNVSVPLFLEYEAATARLVEEGFIVQADLDAVLDYVAAAAQHRSVFFLWRPLLRDPGDDMVLECAVAAQADAIVTFNQRDFYGAERFGLRILTPRELLEEMEK